MDEFENGPYGQSIEGQIAALLKSMKHGEVGASVGFRWPDFKAGMQAAAPQFWQSIAAGSTVDTAAEYANLQSATFTYFGDGGTKLHGLYNTVGIDT